MSTEFKSAEKLGVPIPTHTTHIIRLGHSTTPEERLKALQSGTCGYNITLILLQCLHVISLVMVVVLH